MKDTGLLSVRYGRVAASCHVAVERHLQSVAVGRVIKETAEETSASASLHHIPVKGCVRLKKTERRNISI